MSCPEARCSSGAIRFEVEMILQTNNYYLSCSGDEWNIFHAVDSTVISMFTVHVHEYINARPNSSHCLRRIGVGSCELRAGLGIAFIA